MSTQDNRSIAAAKRGDPMELGELLLAVAPRVERLIRVKLLPHRRQWHDVDDILQEVLHTIVLNIAQLRSDDERVFLQWIERISENKVRDSIRRARAAKRCGQLAQMLSCEQKQAVTVGLDEMPSRGESPSAVVKRKETISAIRAGVAHLPQAQREAIHYHFLDGQSLLETAGTMERTPAAVRGLLQRAGHALRRSMGNSSQWFHRT